jgi:CelD/BcsL family acetyltransferase involved in cellulose biosynthesis
MNLSWIEGYAALEPHFDRWQELSVRTGADIYVTPQWLRAWWPQLGRGRRLVTLLAEKDGLLVGVVPFMIDRIWLGPVPVRVARLAATDPNCMVLTLPIEAEQMDAILEAACMGLLSRYRCALVSLTPVSDLASHLPAILNLAQAGLTLTRMPQGTHCIFDLPATFQDYLDTKLSKKRRGQYRREMNALREQFAMEQRASTPSLAGFDSFVAFHNSQWEAVGKGGHFSDWPRSKEIYRALGQQAEASGGLRFHELTGNIGPMATQMCFVSGKTAHWRLPARTLDADADKLSIGKVGLIQMIETLIADGVARIEAGRGEYEYKTAHGGENIPVHRMVVSGNSALAKMRLKVLLVWSDAVEFCYYRVWFKKIAPELRRRLGWKARPLWQMWIGSRI